jgi:hypothetical protein
LKTQSFILSSETKQAASILAKITFEKYRNNFGHYRNTANSHLVGHLGEFAAFIWLKDNGFNPSPTFLDSSKDRECDIQTNVARIEVKTWSEQYWEKWGRCVSETQIASVKKKADLIFWLTVDGVESETPQATFRGWNEVGIFEGISSIMTGEVGREVRNLQLDPSQLNSMEEMKNYESRRDPPNSN